MRSIDFFYFDLGYVVYRFDHSIGMAKAASITGRTPSQIYAALFPSGLEELYETGFVSSDRLTAECERCLGVPLNQSDFLDAISSIFSFNDSILNVFEILQTQAIPFGLLSNTCEAHWRWIQKQSDVDFSRFASIVLSYEVGCMKPHSKIYAAAEALANASPDRIAFIDDRAENVQAAAARGWQTHLFQQTDEAVEWLRSIV
jgi:glucose-1-phosphatase